MRAADFPAQPRSADLTAGDGFTQRQQVYYARADYIVNECLADRIPLANDFRRDSCSALAPEFIHSMGFAFGQGILISAVSNPGPAAQAGMAVGDILISIDGKKVGAENVAKVISDLPIGKAVPVEVIRNDARKHLLVRVEQKP